MKIYEEQENGTLKPIEYPPELVKKVQTYQWLKDYQLTLDEIRFLCGGDAASLCLMGS